MTDITTTSVSVFIEEETSGDSETDHTTEVVAFFALEIPHVLSLELEEHCHGSEDPCDYIWTCDDLW
jgi:hypothetical protein